MTPPSIVIGIGNRFRRDDASALCVIERLSGRVPASTALLESDGEPARLIDAWADVPIAVVVETVRQNRPPGSVTGIDWYENATPPGGREHGSHSLGVLEAIALGRAVGRMPGKLRLVGIEPEDLGWGEGLTDAVARNVDAAADLVVGYLKDSAADA